MFWTALSTPSQIVDKATLILFGLIIICKIKEKWQFLLFTKCLIEVIYLCRKPPYFRTTLRDKSSHWVVTKIHTFYNPSCYCKHILKGTCYFNSCNITGVIRDYKLNICIKICLYSCLTYHASNRIRKIKTYLHMKLNIIYESTEGHLPGCADS